MIAALDTLQIVKRLKEAGFNDVQAEAVTAVLQDARAGDLAQLATKADLDRHAAATAAALDKHAAAMAAALDKHAAATEAALDKHAAATASALDKLAASARADFAMIRSEIEILRRDLTIRLGGMIVVATGVLLVARFLG